MRWATAAAVMLFTIPPALAADATTGLSLACPWQAGFAACVQRWAPLVPASARSALERCGGSPQIDGCTRTALEKAGVGVLERDAIEAERDRHLGAWAAQRTAKEEPAIRQYRAAQDARATALAAHKAADDASQAQSKAELDKLLVALQSENHPNAAPWWQHGN